MKTLINTVAATALIAAFSAPAFAAVQDDIQRFAGTNGNINVNVNGDTITLTGFAEDNYARNKAEATAKRQGYEVNNYLILK